MEQIRDCKIPNWKFCVLCGQTKGICRTGYISKKLLLEKGGEVLDLGFLCDKCDKRLENGQVFSIPRK